MLFILNNKAGDSFWKEVFTDYIVCILYLRVQMYWATVFICFWELCRVRYLVCLYFFHTCFYLLYIAKNVFGPKLLHTTVPTLPYPDI